VETIRPPPGDFSFLLPVGEAGPNGALHVAWTEAHPDSIDREDPNLADRAFPTKIYYARRNGARWSKPQVVYWSRNTGPGD